MLPVLEMHARTMGAVYSFWDIRCRQRAPLIVCTLRPDICTNNNATNRLDGSAFSSSSGRSEPHPQRQRKLPSYCLRLKHIAATASAELALAAANAASDTTANTVSTPDSDELDEEQSSEQSQQTSDLAIGDLLKVRSIDICDRLKRDNATAPQIHPATPSSAIAIEDAIDDNATDTDTDEESDLDVHESSTGIALNLDGYQMDRFGHLPGDSRTPTPRLGGAWGGNRSVMRAPSPKTRQIIRVTMNDYGVIGSRPNSHQNNLRNINRNNKESTATRISNKL